MCNYSNVSLSTELFSTEDEVIMLHNNFNLFELCDVIIDPTANQFEYDYYLQCFDAYVSLDCCRSSPIAFIPQGKTKINSPKPSYCFKSRIFIDNFRIKYSLFWHDAFCIKQLNDWLDNLKKNELLEVVIDISMNRKPIEIDPSNKTISKEAYHLIFEHANNNPNLISQEYEETWNKILSKNLYNLKIAQPLDEEWIINTLTNSFKSTTNGISKTLKSIDIRLANVEFVEKIINSLRYNYMINSMSLDHTTKECINDDIFDIIKDIRFKRTSIGISLKCNFKKRDTKPIILVYPEEVKLNYNFLILMHSRYSKITYKQ